jgi:GDP-L-fucose synthase
MASPLQGKRIVVTGGAGFLGRAVCQRLQALGASDVLIPRRAGFDLTTETGVERLYTEMRPQIVLHLAAEVGGIGANMMNPGRYFYANMAMAMHMIEGARKYGVEKFLQTGTICAYPKFTPIPFQEENLWNGYPEETNAPYGIAKKAAMVMLDAYRIQYGLQSACVLPVNLYGPHDNFNLQTSHVIPALIRKCVEAQRTKASHIECWGNGSASREFLYVDDAADGLLRAAEVMNVPEPINLGTGKEITIRNLVEMIAKLCDFHGEIRWDITKPDGQPRRCLDTKRAQERLGWQAKVGFEDGLKHTIEWFRKQ